MILLNILLKYYSGTQTGSVVMIVMSDLAVP